MPPVVTPIYLNESDSKKFLMFMQNYEVFTRLMDVGCLNIALGSCIINFDSNKKISSIEVRQTYR